MTNILNVPYIFFIIAFWGIVVIRRNPIIIFMSLELLFLGTNFITLFSCFILDDVVGLLFLLLILTIAASESSIGLAILVIYYKLRGVIKLENINLLKG